MNAIYGFMIGFSFVTSIIYLGRELYKIFKD